MLAILAAVPIPVVAALASTSGSDAVKYLAACLVASQGCLIYTYGVKFTKADEHRTRYFCLAVAVLHLACAGMIIWYSILK